MAAGDNETCADKLTQLNQVVHGLRDLAKGVQVQLQNAEEVAAAAKLVPLLDKEALLAGQGCPMQVLLLQSWTESQADCTLSGPMPTFCGSLLSSPAGICLWGIVRGY